MVEDDGVVEGVEEVEEELEVDVELELLVVGEKDEEVELAVDVGVLEDVEIDVGVEVTGSEGVVDGADDWVVVLAAPCAPLDPALVVVPVGISPRKAPSLEPVPPLLLLFPLFPSPELSAWRAINSRSRMNAACLCKCWARPESSKC